MEQIPPNRFQHLPTEALLRSASAASNKSNDAQFNERDDYTKFLREVPGDASLTAYANDTVSGVRLRYKNDIYEIPQSHYQDAVAITLGALLHKNENSITLRIKKCNDEVLRFAKPHETGDQISTWIVRENLPNRAERLINQQTIISLDNPNLRSAYTSLVKPEHEDLLIERDLQVHHQANATGLIRNGPYLARSKHSTTLDISPENPSQISRVLRKALYETHDNLFPADIQLSLAKLSEAQRERIVERMLDAFDKQVAFERERPKGITPRVASLPVNLMSLFLVAKSYIPIVHELGDQFRERQLEYKIAEYHGRLSQFFYRFNPGAQLPEQLGKQLVELHKMHVEYQALFFKNVPTPLTGLTIRQSVESFFSNILTDIAAHASRSKLDESENIELDAARHVADLTRAQLR
jgi:uncharacterized protein (DUF1778 family)